MPERPLCVLALALSLCPGVLPAQLPAPTARLEGVVVDPLQRPVVGAEVIAEVDGEVRGRTFTDAEGMFVLGRMPQDIVTVRATTKTPDIGGVWVDLVGLERGFARIVTMPARKVTGTVRDLAGAIVPGAWVTSAPCDWADFAHASCVVQADAQGRYVLSHVPMGPVLVRAWAPGCDAGSGTVDGASDSTLDLIVERDGIDVQTFQLADADAAQRAAARVSVSAWRNGVPVPLPPPLRTMGFDADGNARVRGWPRDDTLLVQARVPGALVTPPFHESIVGVNDASRRFHVGAEIARIQGRLVGTELHLAGRRVLLQPLASNRSQWRVVATTAADGSFDAPSPVDRGVDFALRLCDADVTVDGEQPDPCWFVGKHDSVVHEVRVTKACSVRLVAHAPDGSRAAGAEVLVYPALSGARPRHRLAEPLHAFGRLLGRGTTGRDGSVTITGLNLSPGDQIACIVLGDSGWGEVVAQAAPSGTTNFGTARLMAGAQLHLTTLDADGAVIPGGRARAFLMDNDVPLAPFRAADRNGEMRFHGLPPGLFGLFSARSVNAVYQQLDAGPNDHVVR